MTYIKTKHTGDIEAIKWSAETVRWMKSTVTTVFGAILLVAPAWWLGPTWNYLAELPGGVKTVGGVFLLLGVCMFAASWVGNWGAMSALLLFVGVTLCGLAGMLFANGIAQHTSVVTCLFMLFVGAHMIVHGVGLRRY